MTTMDVCERLKKEEDMLGFEGEIWRFKENNNDPFVIIAAFYDSAYRQLAGGAHFGLIGQDWKDGDVAVAHIAEKAKNMREKIFLNHAHKRHDVDGLKAGIVTARVLNFEERKRAFEFLGIVAATISDYLGKHCLVGGDVGTTPQDLLHAWRITPDHVVGRPREDGGVGDTGIPTALGIMDTIESVLQIYEEDGSWSKTAAIQGLGKVGKPLARDLMARRWNLILSDIVSGLFNDVAVDLVRVVIPDAGRLSYFSFVSHIDAHKAAATVFLPCALRPIIRRDTIGEFSSCLKAIVSGQNDEIDPAYAFELAQQLHDRHVVYVPGPAANSMGIQMLLCEKELGLMSYEELFARERVFHQENVQSILQQAKGENSPVYQIAMERIAREVNQ